MTDAVLRPIPLPFETDAGLGRRARIGVVVLETDHTVEAEIRSLGVDDVAWYHSRIPMESEVTPSTLTDMEARLPVAAGLLPREFELNAIGFACTSAATLIGEDGVADAIHSAHPTTPVTNPISAARAAFDALGASRLAVVTPYTADVTAPIVSFLGAGDRDVTAVGSFLESSDHVVAKISETSVAAGVRTVVAQSDCDAVFVSCTSLRAFGVVQALEDELGRPVVSSNLAFAWHLLRLAGVTDPLTGLGSLFRL